MFIAVYRFVAKKGMNEHFCKAWRERTKEIRAEFGSLGSRLHTSEDGSFIAYAQWKSRNHWLQMGRSSEETEARLAMKEATESAETVLELEVVDDLLMPMPLE
jgi:heme-degrading monooxygenase HmoA